MNKLSDDEKKLFSRLSSPAKIQDFLNTIPFNFEPNGETCSSPRVTLERNSAHCLEGALLAAAILWYHKEKPLLLDLTSTAKDFDHVVTLFKKDGFWGAISKTNHAVLRYREPVYKTIRELALSYFHEYFLDDGTKTMRTVSKPFNLKQFGKGWITSTENLWDIGAALHDSPHDPLLTKAQENNLRKADQVEIEAGKIVEFKK